MSEESELIDELSVLLGEDEVEELKERATKDNVAEPKVETHLAAKHDELEPGEIVIVNPIEGHDDLEQMLKFDDLDLALKEQAGLHAFYGAAVARAHLQYNRAKQHVEQIESRAGYAIRNHLIAQGEKVTEKALDERVKMTKMYRNALKCQNDAQYIHKLCVSLLEAFNQREQMIIQSCKRAENEKYMSSGYTSREARNSDIMSRVKKSS